MSTDQKSIKRHSCSWCSTLNYLAVFVSLTYVFPAIVHWNWFIFLFFWPFLSNLSLFLSSACKIEDQPNIICVSYYLILSLSPSISVFFPLAFRVNEKQFRFIADIYRKKNEQFFFSLLNVILSDARARAHTYSHWFIGRMSLYITLFAIIS